MVLSMPLLLTFDIGKENAEDSEDNPDIWNFPPLLSHKSNPTDNAAVLVYDLVGLALINEDHTHFIAWYASHNQKQIFTYDGMKNQGIPVEELGATFATHMCGEDVQLPTAALLSIKSFTCCGVA